MSERRLMSVRSEVVQQTLVDTICKRALARAEEPVPAPVASALRTAPHPALARAGYFVRTVEIELFEPARQPTPGLAEELSGHSAGDATWPGGVSRLASTISNREPLERPDPDDLDAFSWRVPGPGGHVRHYVALRLIGSGPAALKRDVIHGFAVHCCEEVSPP